MDVPLGSFVKVWPTLTDLQKGVVSQRLREGKDFETIAAESGRTFSNVRKAFYAAVKKAKRV